MVVMPLDPPTTAKLAKLLGLLGSAYDGEVLVAARKADALVRAHGLTWGDVITPTPALVQWREPRDGDTLDTVRVCLALDDAPLTAWDIRFLVSISRREQPLSEKQQRQLDRIVDACRCAAMTTA